MNAERRVHLQYGMTDSFCRIPAAIDATVASRFRAGISLARAGDMALSRRFSLPCRARLFADLGMGSEPVFAARQVHSREVLVVDGEEPDAIAGLEADGMITARPVALLTVTVADCLPLFIVDRATAAFGLVHSGWKGTGIVCEAMRLLQERFGTRPADVSVTIGPGIGPCCYTVPDERAASFAVQFGAETVVRGSDGKSRLDLCTANVGLLQKAGVGEVTVVTDCTACSPALGSFRRQGPTGFTLMLAYIGRAS
jgi:YfiH family protein